MTALNVIALTFVLPLEDKVFTRELWEMATECPVVFPDGVGVVPWMVPDKRQTITPGNFRDLARDFQVTLPEEFLYEK